MNFSLVILLMLFCLSVEVRAVEISGELANEFSYIRGERINQSTGQLEDIDMIANTSKLNLGVWGLLGDYQYRLDLNLDGSEFSTQIEQATVSTFLGPTFLEVGKKDWGWSEGFSSSPTYPLEDDEIYLGTEANFFYRGYDLDFGLAMDQDNESLSSGWFKLERLLYTSDYGLVLSYLEDDLEELNLGVDYSKDFLNDLLFYSSFNLNYHLEEDDFKEKFLLGASYYTENKLIIGEYYREDDDFLFLSLRNNNTSNDWSWNLAYTVSLDDSGQQRSLNLSYLGLDDFTPNLEVVNLNDFIDSFDGWEVKFKMIVDLF